MRGSHIHGQRQAGRCADGQDRNGWMDRLVEDMRTDGDCQKLLSQDGRDHAKRSSSRVSPYLLSEPLLYCLTAFWLCGGLNVNFSILNCLLQSFSHSGQKKPKLKSNIAGYKYTKFTYLGKYERETLHFLNYIFNTKVMNLQAAQYLKLQNSAHSCSPSKSLYIGK